MLIKNYTIGILILLIGVEMLAQNKVIVFSKTNGFRHESIEVGCASIQKLGKENNFIVDVTENSEELIANLKKYQAVIFLNTTQDIFNKKEQDEFQKYIENGGGFVGIHSATDTEYDWPWYGNMVGAYFVNHPKPQMATIHIKNQNHQATSFLGDTWEKFDEWYNFKEINPNIRILMVLDESTYEGGKNGIKHPICWTQQIKKGKMFYTGLGHTSESYSNEKFLKHILGGIQSVMNN